jgi:hypothetical protein
VEEVQGGELRVVNGWNYWVLDMSACVKLRYCVESIFPIPDLFYV